MLKLGGGSGKATCFFSKYVKEVKSFEIEKKNFEIIEKNLKFLECENVILKNKDIFKSIEKEKNFDMLFLDMPDIEKIFDKKINLKIGNFIVCYVISISQIEKIVKKVQKEREDFFIDEICEITKRNWIVNEKVARPENKKEIDFTAFLIFIRKIA